MNRDSIERRPARDERDLARAKAVAAKVRALLEKDPHGSVVAVEYRDGREPKLELRRKRPTVADLRAKLAEALR
jgi:hypothetical protein